jgi:hypothetical protein
MDLININTNIKMNIKMLINDVDNKKEDNNKNIYKRKYNYPTKLINKNGKLNKSKKKQIYKWRKDIKDNYLNEDIYTKLKLENEKLKSDIKDYQDALETWVLIAQNK